MITSTLAPPASKARLLLRDPFAPCPPVADQRRLLLFSDDEEFCQILLNAAREAGRDFVRKRAAAGVPRTLHLLKPAAVLLDLDSPAQAAAWDAADSLLQDANSPPLLLLTSRSDQVDFKTAIQAGSLIDKCDCPAKLLEIVSLMLELPDLAHRQRNAMQKVVIRWLRPSNWSAQVIPLHRFWGINE